MGWSRTQQTMFFLACTAAGWNDAQRYIVLRHAGCPERQRAANKGAGVKSEGERRPSASEPRNTQAQFEICMAIAEAAARERGRGADVPQPANARTWGDIEQNARERMIRLVESIWFELVTSMPDVFHASGLVGFVRRMTSCDDRSITLGCAPDALAGCDAGQLYRILEGVKAWGTRECLRRDIRPRTFTLNSLERGKHFARASA